RPGAVAALTEHDPSPTAAVRGLDGSGDRRGAVRAVVTDGAVVLDQDVTVGERRCLHALDDFVRTVPARPVVPAQGLPRCLSRTSTWLCHVLARAGHAADHL